MDILEAICHTNFKVTGKVFPLLRIAIWATMLSTNRHQNNIQKLVTKSDIDKLRSPHFVSKIEVLEDRLQASWKIAMIHSDQNKATICMSRLMIRSILLLLGKQKWSREGCQYEDLDQILEAFTKEMGSTTMGIEATPQGAAEEDIKPTDMMIASSKAIALFQHPHIKELGRYLGSYM